MYDSDSNTASGDARFPILDVLYDGRCSTASNKAYFTNLYVYVMVEVVLRQL